MPAIFAVAHDEPVWPFLVAGAAVSGAGFAVERFTEGGQAVGMREGYLVICLVWIVTAVYGGLPYVLAGDDQLGRPIDALFEGMSGFTTTGASVVTDVDALPRSMLVWRQLTAWLGGIAVVALGLAVLPRLRVGGRQLLESELSTPSATDTISNRIRDTAQRFGRCTSGSPWRASSRWRCPRGSEPATRWTPSRRSGTRCRPSRPPGSPPSRRAWRGSAR